MSRHKFLEKFYNDTGFSHQVPVSEISYKNGKKKLKKFKKKYGFDQRECFDMENAINAWLYEHLCAFEKFSENDMDDKNNTFKFKKKYYTLRQMIHKLKKRLKLYFKYSCMTSAPIKKQNKINEIWDIWQIIAYAMNEYDIHP